MRNLFDFSRLLKVDIILFKEPQKLENERFLISISSSWENSESHNLWNFFAPTHKKKKQQKNENKNDLIFKTFPLFTPFFSGVKWRARKIFTFISSSFIRNIRRARIYFNTVCMLNSSLLPFVQSTFLSFLFFYFRLDFSKATFTIKKVFSQCEKC